MRLRSLGSLCAILLALSGWSCALESLASIREQKICAANPGLCVDGRLVAERLKTPVLNIPLPDLYVENVSCSPLGGMVYINGKICNQGPVPTPGYIDPLNRGFMDISATVSPGAGMPVLTTSVGLAAAADPMHPACDHYDNLATFPNGDPTNLPLTYFQVYANLPEPPDYPYGKFWESNLQNNYACGLCQCDPNRGCITTQTQQQCVGGP